MKSSKSNQTPCPCESGKAYSACCEQYHLGLSNHLGLNKQTFAHTAEALMRSRYSAFVFSLEDYLLQTWHPDTRPISLNLSDDVATKWLGLQIKRTENTGENSAIVEFIARYKIGGKAERLHEVSQFQKIKQQWYYLAGQFANHWP